MVADALLVPDAVAIARAVKAAPVQAVVVVAVQVVAAVRVVKVVDVTAVQLHRLLQHLSQMTKFHCNLNTYWIFTDPISIYQIFNNLTHESKLLQYICR